MKHGSNCTVSHRERTPRTGRIAAGALALLLAAGCAVGPDYEPPEPPAGDEEAGFAALDADSMTASPPEMAWWQQLGIEELNGLIGEAAAHNHDLRIARANVLRARALLTRGRLDRFPAITASGEITREQPSSAQPDADFESRDTLYQAGFDAAWELDFFGRVTRSVQALTAGYEAQVAERRFTFVTVAAEVARSYVELRGTRHRLDVARRNVANQERTLEMTRALREGGRGTELDVAQARAQLESTRATIPLLRTGIERARHRLAVLVGRPPTALDGRLATSTELPALPRTLRVGDPAELLRRRPDVAAAERRLAAETANIGVAVADLFPRVTLLGSAGYLATDSGEFGSAASEYWNIGPVLSWAAFDLGDVRARIDAAEADADAALAAYERAVLTALEETENALVNYVQTRSRTESLTAAAGASTRAAAMARQRYRSGVADFLTVLDAERRQLEAQDALATARMESVLALVAVYKALGGGRGQSPAAPEER